MEERGGKGREREKGEGLRKRERGREVERKSGLEWVVRRERKRGKGKGKREYGSEGKRERGGGGIKRGGRGGGREWLMRRESERGNGQEKRETEKEVVTQSARFAKCQDVSYISHCLLFLVFLLINLSRFMVFYLSIFQFYILYNNKMRLRI